VRSLVERQFGVKYSEVHIWRLLGQLGFSSQRPDRRALERDDGAVEHWKKRTLPSLKKKRGAKGG
jgi:transposase